MAYLIDWSRWSSCKIATASGRFVNYIQFVSCCPSVAFENNGSKFEWGLTLLWRFYAQLFHQGSTLVLELGPHKDREKLWPGWDLNPRPSD